MQISEIPLSQLLLVFGVGLYYAVFFYSPLRTVRATLRVIGLFFRLLRFFLRIIVLGREF